MYSDQKLFHLNKNKQSVDVHSTTIGIKVVIFVQ